jgi:hypothetical protein
MFIEGDGMKTKIFQILLGIMACGLIFQGGCKTADETGSSQCILTVRLSEGVSGAPAPGTYTYTEGETVSYFYTLMEGYRNMVVTLDGAEVPASGMINVCGNQTLEAGVAAPLDVRGKWKGWTVWYGSPTQIEEYYFEVIFEGGLSSGNIKISIDFLPSTYGSIYEVSGNEVEFKFTFSYFVSVHFWGTAESENRITGIFEYGVGIYSIARGTFYLERE